MLQDRHQVVISRLIGWFVILYGFVILTGVILRTGIMHPIHVAGALVSSITPLIGISYLYLGALLLRRKFNAWLTAVALSVVTFIFNGLQLVRVLDDDTVFAPHRQWIRVVLPVIVLALLVASRAAFRVRSDVRSFQQAVRLSLVLLVVTILYGTAGFMLLDRHDLGHEVHIGQAVEQTVDQFGLTTDRPVAHSRRARIFLDSLPVISIGTLAYVALSFFQPLRQRLSSRDHQREQAARLLADYPSDIDDFFKLWPHDKNYYFSRSGETGLAYHVSRGVALVAGDPFGDPQQIGRLISNFRDLCFVNDWQPAFVHVSDRFRQRYERRGLELQKIGEEAILDIAAFSSKPRSKYFRQIGNRFAKLGYHTELLSPPHDPEILGRLREISDGWLKLPGREERGFMLGYFNEDYLQQGPLMVARDQAGIIQGFINLVQTFEPDIYNYDLLRCSSEAPGNCNDFLLLGLISELAGRGATRLNLGLCPLAGLDEKAADASLIDNALRFVYANGDRLYSFSGLRRFKAKYEPNWEPRYIAYQGGIRNFTRVVTAFNRVSKIK